MPPSTQTAALLSPSTNAKRAMMPHILPGAAHLRHSNPTKRTSTASSPVCCPLLFLVTGNTRSHSHWHRRHYHAPLHNKPTVTSLTSYGHRPMLMHPSTKPRVWSVPPPPQPLLAGTAQESTLYYATMTPSPTGCDGTTQHLVVTGDLYIDPATSIPQRAHRQCDTLTPCLLARTRTIAPGNGYCMLACTAYPATPAFFVNSLRMAAYGLVSMSTPLDIFTTPTLNLSLQRVGTLDLTAYATLSLVHLPLCTLLLLPPLATSLPPYTTPPPSPTTTTTTTTTTTPTLMTLIPKPFAFALTGRK